MRQTQWDRLFYATPGCWYGTPTGTAPGSTGHIVVDPACAVEAIVFLRARAPRIGLSLEPGIRVLADGGLLLTLERVNAMRAGEAAPRPRGLVGHVLAMADDAYLTGHPEWAAIVDEARALDHPA